MNNLLDRIKGGLIVSCQALVDSPLYGPAHMAAMAECAQLGGAVGIRANGVADIRAIKERVTLPIVGILKRRDLGPVVWITPDFESAEAIARAGAEIIAMDATNRPRPIRTTFAEVCKAVKDSFPVMIMADISTLNEGVAAVEAGADIVATTLSGYTDYSPQMEDPDLPLVEALTKRIGVPVIAEGRYGTPAQARRAIDCGAHCVVVGQAITSPTKITERFVSGMRRF